jgi:hypothetical protein
MGLLGLDVARWSSNDGIKDMALRNPDAMIYFDFFDCGNKFCNKPDCIMTLLGIIIPNPDDIWIMGESLLSRD